MHARRLSHIDMSGHFLAQLSANSKHLTQPLRNDFGTLAQIIENPPICPAKYSIVQGKGGVPDLFMGLES